MFKFMKELFTSENKDLRHRIYYTLAALTIFVLGCSIRVPGTKDLTESLGFLELLNTIGGGALKNFSIFALGVMPYITASIIMQLLTIAIPSLEQLSKEGEEGRKKIQSITRYVSIGIACVLALGVYSTIANLGATSGVGTPEKIVLIFSLVVG